MLNLSAELLLLALIVLWIGSLLVKYAEEISEITGIGQIFIGSILLAAATSLPELVVDANAVLMGWPNLAVADLFGSSLLNLLILGVADLIHKERGTLFNRESAKHALSGVLSVTLACLAALSLLITKLGHNYSIYGIGVGPILIGLTYLAVSRIMYFDTRPLNAAASPSKKTPGFSPKLKWLLLKYMFCCLGLLIVAPRLAKVADEISILSGLGRTFIGTTLVAGVTSLPEVVSTFTAVRRGAFGLAVGNIFGSNAFNMAILLPLDILFPGDLMSHVDITQLLTCLFTIFITTIAISGQLYQVPERRRFIDPDALIVITLVIISLFLLFVMRDSGAAM